MVFNYNGTSTLFVFLLIGDKTTTTTTSTTTTIQYFVFKQLSFMNMFNITAKSSDLFSLLWSARTDEFWILLLKYIIISYTPSWCTTMRIVSLNSSWNFTLETCMILSVVIFHFKMKVAHVVHLTAGVIHRLTDDCQSRSFDFCPPTIGEYWMTNKFHPSIEQWELWNKG